MRNNRFKNELEPPAYNIIIPVLSFILIFALFYLAITQLAGNSQIRQLQTLENAVHKDILHCFASEGEYPESIEYLEENYALTYDHDRFSIEYTPGASNTLPEVRISVKQQ